MREKAGSKAEEMNEIMNDENFLLEGELAQRNQNQKYPNKRVAINDEFIEERKYENPLLRLQNKYVKVTEIP